jgi:hypothetical protein
MPVQGLGSQSQFAAWRAPQFARAIEYPLEIMEEIRAFACDELLQLSHGGDEVGGVLFGTRSDDLLRILTWRPIACEHKDGEGLRLSGSDRLNLAVQLEVARQNPDLKDLRPLGCFVSHLHGEVSLSPTDLEIYNSFFPEACQVALVICPKGSGRAQAGFFVREANDKVVSEASYQCFDLEPLLPTRAARPEQSEPAAVGAPLPSTPVQATPVQPAPVQPAPVRRSEPQLPAPPAEETPAPNFPSPSFEVEDRLPTRERWLWAMPIALALGIAAFMLYQQRTPNTAIALRVSSEAQTVQLAWDANSRAVRDSDHAAIEITDGGKSSEISLNAAQLHAGKMSYVPQSSDIGFAMTVYPANGDAIHDSTRLIAPAFNAPAAPTQPPQLVSAGPVPASAPAPAPDAEHDALEQQQVQQLKQDLGRERARADELQNLVRILEDRLGIPHEEPKPARRP